MEVLSFNGDAKVFHKVKNRMHDLSVGHTTSLVSSDESVLTPGQNTESQMR